MSEFGNAVVTTCTTLGSNDGPPPPYPENNLAAVRSVLGYNFRQTWRDYPELVEWVADYGESWEFMYGPITPTFETDENGQPTTVRILDTWTYTFGWYVNTELAPVESLTI